MDSKSLGSRLGNIAEKHREQQEWRKHRMAWKFPTRKNYENWLASQRATPEPPPFNLNSNANTTTTMGSNGEAPMLISKTKSNRCIAGFGGKKYMKKNGKWVACGGKRKTMRKRRGSRTTRRRR